MTPDTCITCDPWPHMTPAERAVADALTASEMLDVLSGEWLAEPFQRRARVAALVDAVRATGAGTRARLTPPRGGVPPAAVDNHRRARPAAQMRSA